MLDISDVKKENQEAHFYEEGIRKIIFYNSLCFLKSSQRKKEIVKKIIYQKEDQKGNKNKIFVYICVCVI